MVPNLALLIDEIAIFLATPFGNDSSNFIFWLSQRPLIANWGRREVYQSCLNRLPEFESDWNRDYDSRAHCADHVAHCLVSHEFRNRAISIIGGTMPKIPRTFFVHIPRTGGSSVKMAIEHGFQGLCWHVDHLEDEWFLMYARRFGLDPLLFMLKFLGQFASRSSNFLIVGHRSLGSLFGESFIRAGDRVFTVIRSPEQLIYSALNHIVDVVTGNSNTPDALDWREWMNELDVKWSPRKQLTIADLKTILKSKRFALEYSNPQTQYLGHDGTVAGAVSATSMVRCSVLTQKSVHLYLARELGLAAPIGVHNRSQSQSGQLLKSSTLKFVQETLCNLDIELLRSYDETNLSFTAQLRDEPVQLQRAKLSR